MARKIPAVMFSQHPDHASQPYWHKRELIKTHDELKECYLMFSELGGDEVMWDWEGKLVDEGVTERLLSKYTDFFQQKLLGQDVFLTFRVPNPRVESGYRLARAFMVILSGQHLAHTAGFPTTPLFEVILPMTTNAQEMINMQKNFLKFAKAASSSFGASGFSKTTIEVIPIFEEVKTILGSGEIVRKYAQKYQKQFGTNPSYIRPFCARSDPALNSGIVPTTLAVKWALSQYALFSKESGIPTYPIIAPGALPFRGGLTPKNAENFIKEFAGIRTLVIQSSFRYDYPLKDVQAAIKRIQEQICKIKTKILPADYLKKIEEVIPYFEKPYKQAVEKLAPYIAKVAEHIPQRRERMQHIGLFGYSRQVGETKLPRAIGFCASCYSLGIPPELIGTGRGLKKTREEGKLEFVESLYLELKPALKFAGRYFRKESLAWLRIPELEEDIKEIEKYLGEKLGPKTQDEKKHAELVAKIIDKIEKGQDPQQEIVQAALLRHSLG